MSDTYGDDTSSQDEYDTGTASEDEWPSASWDQFKDHPYDTYFTGGTRFLIELLMWVLGPWLAVTQVHDHYPNVHTAWLVVIGIITFILLIAIPGLFSTPTDKLKCPVHTPGAVRAFLELGFHAIVVVAGFYCWTWIGGLVCAVVAAIAVVAGAPRLLWLFQGAPERWGEAHGFKRHSGTGV